jgi:hypothetical protein
MIVIATVGGFTSDAVVKKFVLPTNALLPGMFALSLREDKLPVGYMFCYLLFVIC